MYARKTTINFIVVCVNTDDWHNAKAATIKNALSSELN